MRTGIEAKVHSMQMTGVKRALLCGDLLEYCIPETVISRVKNKWGEGMDDEQVEFSHDLVDDRSVLVMRFIGFDTNRQMSISVVYQMIHDGRKTIKVHGEDEFYSGELPRDKKDQERFYNAVDRALENPYLKPVSAHRLNPDD